MLEEGGAIVLIVHLFISFAHVNWGHFFSSSWYRGLAAASACERVICNIYCFFVVVFFFSLYIIMIIIIMMITLFQENKIFDSLKYMATNYKDIHAFDD